MKIELFASCLKQLHLLGIGRARPPHPWAGRKDLKGVGPEFRGAQCRSFQGPRSECVNADPQKAMVPEARPRWRLRLPASILLPVSFKPADQIQSVGEISLETDRPIVDVHVPNWYLNGSDLRRKSNSVEPSSIAR